MKHKIAFLSGMLFIILISLMTINLVKSNKEYVYISQNRNFGSSITIADNSGRHEIDYDHLCNEEGFRNVAKIAGIIILFGKWIGPLILIVLGMVDYGKAMISDDEKSLSKATSTFIKRMIIAIIIPFIPGLIFVLIDFIDEAKDIENDAEFISCTECLKNPLSNCQKK